MLAKLLTYVQHVNSTRKQVSMLEEHLIVYFHYQMLVLFRHFGWMPPQRNVPQSPHFLLSESKPGWERFLTSDGTLPRLLLLRENALFSSLGPFLFRLLLQLRRIQLQQCLLQNNSAIVRRVGARPSDLSGLAVRAGGKTELFATR
jgi:hypothetical protein